MRSEIEKAQDKRDQERKENKKLNAEIMTLKVRERDLLNKQKDTLQKLDRIESASHAAKKDANAKVDKIKKEMAQKRSELEQELQSLRSELNEAHNNHSSEMECLQRTMREQKDASDT